MKSNYRTKRITYRYFLFDAAKLSTFDAVYDKFCSNDEKKSFNKTFLQVFDQKRKIFQRFFIERDNLPLFKSTSLTLTCTC